MNVPARASRLLTDILLEAGVVTQEQIDLGLARQRKTGLRIGESLVEMGTVRAEDIGWALARQLGIPFVDVSLDAIDHELVRGFGDTLLHRLQALPLVRGADSLSVAFADPTDPDSLAEIERIAGCPLEMGVATPMAIRSALDAVFGHRREINLVDTGVADSTPHNVLWDRTGSAFVAFHVRQALLVGATELHFIPSGGALMVEHRVGGRLVPHAQEPASAIYGVLARLESQGVPVVDALTRWGTGRFELEIANRRVQVEASLLVEEDGIVVVMSLTPCGSRVPSLDDLGAAPPDLARVRDALAEPEGLVLIAAPPRAGGTTTLVSLLDAIDRAGRRVLHFGRKPALPLPAGVHLVNDADPVAGAWQNMARGLGADVVALDGVAADCWHELAGPAASGRLLLARVEAGDALGLLARLARLDARDVVAERLRFVWHQRLAPTDGAAKLGDDGRRADRQAVVEVVHATDAVRDALREGASAARFREALLQDGGRPSTGRGVTGGARKSGAEGAGDAHPAPGGS